MRKLIAEQKLGEACDVARALLSRRRARRQRLDAMRAWVDCEARRGGLARARQRLATRPATAVALYGRALVALASWPPDVTAARRLLRRAARRAPEESEIVYRQALLSLADERPRRALQQLERACRLEPTARCAVARAHLLLDVGRPRAALAAARQAVERQPRPIDVRRGRALVRRLERRRQRIPGAARAAYRKALRQLLDQQRPEGCISRLRELLLDHPQLAPAHKLLGLAYFQLGRSADAVVSFRQTLELDPFDATSAFYLGVIYRSRHRWRAAARAFRRALELNPFAVRTAVELGRALRRLKRAAEAAAVLERVVALAGGSHVSLRLAGRAHLAAGSLADAKRHFERLLKKEPRDFEAHLRLAQVLLALHHKGGEDRAKLRRQARDHATEAAAIRPDDPEVKRLLRALSGR